MGNEGVGSQMKRSWKPVVLACLCAVAAWPSLADNRGGDRKRERLTEFDRRGEVSERRAADRARDRRRHLSEEERARLRRDVLEAFRAGRGGR